MAAQDVLNDTRVQELLNDPNMRREFPFLATVHARMTLKKGDCRGCGRKTPNNAGDLAEVRANLGKMSIESKAKLKRLLGGKQVVVKYRSGDRSIKVKF